MLLCAGFLLGFVLPTILGLQSNIHHVRNLAGDVLAEVYHPSATFEVRSGSLFLELRLLLI